MWTMFNSPLPFRPAYVDEVSLSAGSTQLTLLGLLTALLCVPSLLFSELLYTYTCGCVHTSACLLYGQGLLSLRIEWLMRQSHLSLTFTVSQTFGVSQEFLLFYPVNQSQIPRPACECAPLFGISFSKMIS